jgi:hypothetical protein
VSLRRAKQKVATCRGCDQQHCSLLPGASVGVLLLGVMRADGDTDPRKCGDICEKFGVEEPARRKAESVRSCEDLGGSRHLKASPLLATNNSS